MNTKFLAPLVGALILGTSTLALADRGPDRYSGFSHERAWQGRGSDDHRFERDRRPDFHHDRWYAPRGYWVPAPPPVYYGQRYYAPRYERDHDRDGVSIILRGRIN
jgi:hypothetical protein